MATDSLKKNKTSIPENKISAQHISSEKLQPAINAATAGMNERQTVKALFAKDPMLWVDDPAQISEIGIRLGWLTLPDHYTKNTEALTAFAQQVSDEGYTHAVLLGMGGSSLCSEVARKTYGSKKGFLQLFVLDNTDPEAILDLEKKIDPEKTLFIVASKSGGTEETISFFRYFYEELKKKNIAEPGKNFVAITDEGTSLVKLAADHRFRKVFINPSDLGGRYSVLSDFGLVPMALMGIDINAFLSGAHQMELSCEDPDAASNPAFSLGILLGVCQQHGKDKVTFILSSSISSFGYWVEQLIAESTGKEGKGLIPVNGELPGTPEVYGSDRVFVHMYLATDNNTDDNKKIKALEDAGHPVVRINVSDKIALGGEYYRWEVATAVAGIIMRINAFDQPNVEESKKNTKKLLEDWTGQGAFRKADPLVKTGQIAVFAGKTAKEAFPDQPASARDAVSAFTARAKNNDYIALLPYFMLTGYRTAILKSWRDQLRNDRHAATTLLNGPRYLHSTGQLHKGGPDTGLYIIITGDEKEQLPIPDKKFGFATLHQAQALGDFQSLDEKSRRVIRIHLGNDIDAGLNILFQALNEVHQKSIL